MSCGCNPTNGFKNFAHFGLSTPISKIEKNIQFFLDWAFLEIGAWVEIRSGFPGPNGEDMSLLQQVDCYVGGTASQGWRANWVHETGVTYTDTLGGVHSPSSPSVSGNINYKYGYIEGVVASAEYSAKQVSVLIANEESWWKELELNSWDIEDSFFTRDNCGTWTVGTNSQNRVQLPAVVIDSFGASQLIRRGLGDCVNGFNIPIDLYIYTDQKCDRQNIADILNLQEYKQFCLFDPDGAQLPLDCNGFLNPLGMQYPDLLTNHLWGCARINSTEIRSFAQIHTGLYEGIIRWNMEVYPQ